MITKFIKIRLNSAIRLTTILFVKLKEISMTLKVSNISTTGGGEELRVVMRELIN